MFIPRFFYDIAAPTEVALSPAGAPAPAPSIAAMAAKGGRLVHPGDDGPAPTLNIAEKKEEPKPAPAAPAEANVAKPAEQAKPESPKPAPESKKEEPQTAAPAQVPSWQEVLRNQQPDAILKELGYGDNLVNFLKGKKDLDPKLTGFFDHWEKNQGNVKDYLRALDTNFEKMSPEDVMRYQLQVQNPELDAKQLDRLFKLKVIDHYKLDPTNYTEEEVEDGRLMLGVDTKPIRQQLAEQQKQFLFPQPAPKEAEVNPEAEAEKQRIAEYKNFVSEHPLVKALQSQKAWSEGDGEDKYSFPIEPQEILDVLLDDGKWAESLHDPGTKQADAEKLLLLGLVARHGKKFLNDYASHYRKIGGRSAIAPIENVKPPDAGTPAKAEVTDGNPAAAAARRGRYVPGNR